MIGVAHPDLGEAVVAVVVPRKTVAMTEGAIMSGVATDLAKFKQPKKVMVVDALPRNTMGKVQKNVLRQDYGDLFLE